MSQAYPLHWPAGWPRTAPQNLDTARFKTTLPAALDNLQRQIKMLGGRNVVLSSNYTLGANNPDDPGVVAYFEWCADADRFPSKWQPMAIPCDRWNRIEANVQAIALTVEAMRGMERWGAKHMITAMFTGFKQLPAGGAAWWTVLGVAHNANAMEIKNAYRELVSRKHPDKGGSQEEFMQVQQAYETARAQGLVS